MNDEIMTIALSGDDEQLLNEFLAHLRAFPGYAKDNAKVGIDTRRGGYTTRYATFIIHKQ
jgi:hypothetical protein